MTLKVMWQRIVIVQNTCRTYISNGPLINYASFNPDLLHSWRYYYTSTTVLNKFHFLLSRPNLAEQKFIAHKCNTFLQVII